MRSIRKISCILLCLVMVGMVFAMPVNVMATDPIPDGMVSYWRLDEGSGNVAGDSAGGNDGSLNPSGPKWVNGKIYQGLSFDGQQDYVHTSIPLSGTLNTFTYELWAYPRSYNPSTWYDWTGAVLLARRGHVQDVRLNLQGDGRLEFSIHDSSKIRHEVTSNSVIGLNTFSHIVATYDGSTMKIYINGNLDASSADTFDINWDTDRRWFRMGCGEGMLYFNGIMDEVAVWDQALSSNTIQNHYINGLMGFDYFKLSPDQALQNLFDDIQNIEEQPDGTETNLISKLDAALEAIDNGNENAAVNILNAFINAVSAQSGKKLTVEEADALIAAAQDILNGLNGGP